MRDILFYVVLLNSVQSILVYYFPASLRKPHNVIFPELLAFASKMLSFISFLSFFNFYIIYRSSHYEYNFLTTEIKDNHAKQYPEHTEDEVEHPDRTLTISF